MSSSKPTTPESRTESGILTAHAHRVLAEQERQKAAREAAEAGAEAAQVADAIDGASADTEASWAAMAEAAALSEDNAVATTVQEALAMRHMLREPTQAAKETLGRPRGERKALGRIMGRVSGSEKISAMFEGKQLDSTALIGQFMAVVTERDNEIIQARRLFLSRAFSEAIASALATAQRNDPAAIVHVNIDVGWNSTGKSPVSYEWTISYLQDGIAIRAMRDALMRPRKLAGATTPRIEAA